MEPNCPVLAICLNNGRMQLMRHEMDDNAICIDTGMRPCKLKWNNNGSVCAKGCNGSLLQGLSCCHRMTWLLQNCS